MTIWAHTSPDKKSVADGGVWHPLRDHILGVAELAKSFADAFDQGDKAYLAGLLHDLGKYGTLFQDRLQGKVRGVDHWSIGAWEALSKCLSVPIALAVEGHHVGLQIGSAHQLQKLDPKQKQSELAHQDRRLSEQDVERLLALLKEDLGADPRQCRVPQKETLAPTVSSLLATRMLFSCLVDADFLDTEAHFSRFQRGGKHLRKAGVELKPSEALPLVDQELARLNSSVNVSRVVREVREELSAVCLGKAELPVGSFTLTAPTGAGKTLAMLRFALAHAKKHDLRRIIIVVPFLSIIEQTVDVYRRLFESTFGPEYILEHHSLANFEEGDRDLGTGRSRPELLSENWDAPIVVTTSVQFFESLFSNKPGACRKLHRISKSVVLFDEAQTLPKDLAVPTLAALSALTETYRTSVVFATATQPAFSSLSPQVHEAGSVRGWLPTEINSTAKSQFARMKRVSVLWPESEDRLSCEQLAEELEVGPSALVILNLKKQAQSLFSKLLASGQGRYHLSTAMCPAHRREVLQSVRSSVLSRQTLLISTQCVEAGVDLDFPRVYRAMGPLDSIAQAAGRCNRNGRLEEGEVRVFRPEKIGKVEYPPGGYEQAVAVTRVLLAKYGKLDINSPEIYDEYFRTLYSISATFSDGIQKALNEKDFIKLAGEYRLIRQESINILVPYDRSTFALLRTECEQTGLTSSWLKKARVHAVSTFPFGEKKRIWSYLSPLKYRNGEDSDQWFVLTDESLYDPKLGLIEPKDEVGFIF